MLWLVRDPQQLSRMAESSKGLGHPDAAKRVVDLAISIKG
jgi:UDP-N-acetylglucosamine:LPS N-acetylglucosamine transferase